MTCQDLNPQPFCCEFDALYHWTTLLPWSGRLGTLRCATQEKGDGEGVLCTTCATECLHQFYPLLCCSMTPKVSGGLWSWRIRGRRRRRKRRVPCRQWPQSSRTVWSTTLWSCASSWLAAWSGQSTLLAAWYKPSTLAADGREFSMWCGVITLVSSWLAAWSGPSTLLSAWYKPSTLAADGYEFRRWFFALQISSLTVCPPKCYFFTKVVFYFLVACKDFIGIKLKAIATRISGSVGEFFTRQQ